MGVWSDTLLGSLSLLDCCLTNLMAEYKEVKSIILRENSRRPVKVTILEKGEIMYLDLRYMYRKDDGELGHTTQGIRLEIDDETAEDTLMAAQALGEELLMW